MNDKEIIEKADRGEQLTVEEVIRYNEIVKPVNHVYGKYGTLALKYIEEHQRYKLMTIIDLPKYLHGIDRQAEDLGKVLRDKLSKSEQYKRTGDFMEDYRRIEATNKAIEEEILSELVYVD